MTHLQGVTAGWIPGIDRPGPKSSRSESRGGRRFGDGKISFTNMKHMEYWNITNMMFNHGMLGLT